MEVVVGEEGGGEGRGLESLCARFAVLQIGARIVGQKHLQQTSRAS